MTLIVINSPYKLTVFKDDSEVNKSIGVDTLNIFAESSDTTNTNDLDK